MIKARKTILFIFSFVGLCVISGCSKEHYAREADEQVYKIIDQKWQPQFGTKNNYKISDTAPSPNDVQIAKVIPESGILTLPQAVAIATAHNREYQTQKEALYIAALDLRLFRHKFEPQPFSGSRAGYAKEGEDEGIGSESDFGFEQMLATGAIIGAKVSAVSFDVLTGDLNSGLASLLTVSAIQPLLRGSNPEIVREPLTQAERDTLYQIRSFSRFRKTFVVSIISQYYTVLGLSDKMNNSQANYETFSKTYETIRKLTDAGRLPRHELDQANQDKLQAWDTYIEAKKEYELALDEFKFAMALPIDAAFQLDATELKVLAEAEVNQPHFSEKDAIDTALAERLDLANTFDAVADAERKVIVAADALGAEMNIFFGIDATSLTSSSDLPGAGALDDDFVTDRFRLNTMRRLRDNNPQRNFRDRAVGGIDLELPLDRVAEQNVYRTAMITLNQRQRDYEQTVDWVTLEVRQACRDITEATQRRKLQLEALALAQKRYKNTLLLVQYGRTSSRRVLDSQKDFFDAQNTATEALITHAIATLNFYRDTEELQVQPDGMWQQKVVSKKTP